jgi:hypothetical protein
VDPSPVIDTVAGLVAGLPRDPEREGLQGRCRSMLLQDPDQQVGRIGRAQQITHQRQLPTHRGVQGRRMRRDQPR